MQTRCPQCGAYVNVPLEAAEKDLVKAVAIPPQVRPPSVPDTPRKQATPSLLLAMLIGAIGGLSVLVGLGLLIYLAIHAHVQPGRDRGTAPTGILQQPNNSTRNLKIVSVDAKIIERGDNYCTWSWRVDIVNPTNRAISYAINVQFLDAAGFEVDFSYETGEAMPGRHAITGQELISTKLSATINRTLATLD